MSGYYDPNYINTLYPDFESKWQALVTRDPRAAKAFLYCVKSTGIFCRPTCAARLSKRKNVEFYDTLEAALAAGYRACKRCKPLQPENEVHFNMIRRTCRVLDGSPEAPVNLKVLADHVGLTQWHFHRLFKRFTGITPKMYWEARHLPEHKQTKKIQEVRSRIESIARMDASVVEALKLEKKQLRPRKQLDEVPGIPSTAGLPVSAEDLVNGYDDKSNLQMKLDELNNEEMMLESFGLNTQQYLFHHQSSQQHQNQHEHQHQHQHQHQHEHYENQNSNQQHSVMALAEVPDLSPELPPSVNAMGDDGLNYISETSSNPTPTLSAREASAVYDFSPQQLPIQSVDAMIESMIDLGSEFLPEEMIPNGIWL